MAEIIEGGTIVLDREISFVEPNKSKIVVDLKRQKVFADEIEITGIRSICIEYGAGMRKRCRIQRFGIDKSGKPMVEFGALFEQDLEFHDFEVIA
jgi:hypothetical protein